MKIPQFQNKKELYRFLIENKSLIIADKKQSIKTCDEFVIQDGIDLKVCLKAVNESKDTEDELYRDLIINTTNYLDSHDDVHIPGLWNKSLKERKDRFHLAEHNMDYENVITYSDDIKAFTQEFKWKDLGYKVDGTTQALVYSVIIKKDVNPKFFDKYLKNRVKQHSVRMQYVKMLMAVNDKDYKEEYKAWNDYYSLIINKNRADEMGYFFPILEAKEIEGSAVLLGSNPITPTLQNKTDALNDNEPDNPLIEVIEPQTNNKRKLYYY